MVDYELELNEGPRHGHVVRRACADIGPQLRCNMETWKEIFGLTRTYHEDALPRHT